MAKFPCWKANTKVKGYVAPSSAIIANHSIVDDYANIPEQYMAAVKSMMVDYAGESHSRGLRIGVELLASFDADYAAQTNDGGFQNATTSYLRMGRHDSVGEEDFFTNATAIATIKGVLDTQHTAENEPDILCFGWCYDMTGNNDPTQDKDSVYGCGWGGSCSGGPEGDLPWGLDAADTAITGNSVCMDTYLDAVDEYNDYCTTNGYTCKAVFTTGPVDDGAGNEKSYQREMKHEYIRYYVNSTNGILFDYADILCYDAASEQATATWSGHTFEVVHPDNLLDYDEEWNMIEMIEDDNDHIGQVGAMRLAKAMWWLLARLAGWDGN